MLDLIVLFTIFCGLIGILVLAHFYWVAFSFDPVASKELLDEWLQAHKLDLPDVPSILSVLNRQLQEIESEEWEKLELTHLLPKTELPVFHLFKAELSPDNRDIVLHCTIEWPMCLPGVSVTALEKGVQQPVVCHFAIDWMSVEMEIKLSEQNGTLLLSSRNTQPFRMGVACMVAEGPAKDPEKMASAVADFLQEMLMDLKLDRVPLVPVYNHTPPVPLVLVSFPEESVLSLQVEDQATPDATPNSEPAATTEPELPLVEDESYSVTYPVTIATPADSITPIIEEVEPMDQDATSFRPLSLEIKKKEAIVVNNGSPPQLETSEPKPVQVDTTPESSNVSPPCGVLSPTSPGWRRTPSYENLQEISVPLTPTAKKPDASNVSLYKRSSSSDHLSSPSHPATTPAGKALTLSMTGSEAESIYGADERIPSMLIFEVNDAFKVQYIVALSTAHARNLRRHFTEAKKLHIYNDHTFMATHLKNRTECVVCKQKIIKLFGKQAYCCRDCDVVVHKQCHWKVEDHCPSSTVPSMNLIYPDSISVSNL